MNSKVLSQNNQNNRRQQVVKLLLVLCLVGAIFSKAVTAQAATVNVYITTNTIPLLLGYMNWYTNLTDWTNNVRIDGSAWAWPDLPAVFNSTNGVVTLSPNTSTYNPANPYWVNPDGSGAKVMEANFYAQDDSLAGNNIVFQGNCWANTLTNGYFTRAFIKMFNSNYSSFVAVYTNVVSGQPFRLALIGNTNYPHVQWGYLTVGKNANPATVAGLGSVVLASNAQPTTVTITVPPQNTYALVGSNVVFSAQAFGSSLNYRWQKDGVNLTNSGSVSGVNTATLTLTGVTTNSQGTYTVVVTNSSSADSASGVLTVVDPNNLTIDSKAPWAAYMNWYTNINNTQGTYYGGSTWGINDLQARFNNGVLTLLPNTNTYDPTNTFWVSPSGQGNFFMEALCYQQWDALSGQTITFNGYCLSNTLASSYAVNAFIREQLPDYSAFEDVLVPLVAGQPFTVSKATSPGNHIQWGFVMVGTNASPASLPALGSVVLYKAATLPNPPVPPTMSVSKNGGFVYLSYNTQTGFSYTLQYKTNLADSVWQTLSTTSGTGNLLTVTNSPAGSSRFYRVTVQ